MNLLMRRFATLLLLFAIPLRVYAAVAMMFCGQTGAGMHDPHIAAPQIQEQSSLTLAETIHDHSGDGSMEHGHHHDHAGDGASHQHLSCAACCCAGMIATAQYAWKPRPFARPATPSFISSVVPHTVPHRLERPPRAIFA